MLKALQYLFLILIVSESISYISILQIEPMDMDLLTSTISWSIDFVCLFSRYAIIEVQIQVIELLSLQMRNEALIEV